MIVFGDEPGAEVICAASTAEQAGIVFKGAKAIIELDEDLLGEVRLYQYSIVNGLSTCKAISAKPGGQHGHNPSVAIIDELHTHRNRDLYDAIVTGQGSRTQPLLIIITTGGDGSSDIYEEVDDYAHKVMNGVIEDEAFLPVIYEAQDGDDIRDPKVWRKANPNFGVSLQEEFFKDELKKALQSPAYENTFKRLYLNITTKTRDGYISDMDWQKSGQPFEYAELLGKKCWGGMDLSSTSDFSCFTLVFPDFPKVYFRTWYWLPEEKGKNSADKNNSLYTGWVRDEWIEETVGNVIDYDLILEKILYLNSIYDIQKIAYDPHNAASVISGLYANGINCEAFKQWAKDLNIPTKELERQVKMGNLYHNNDPVSRWSVANCEVYKDTNDNWKIMKNPKKPERKVDPIVALIMGFGQWIADTNPYEVVEKSYYSGGKSLVGA